MTDKEFCKLDTEYYGEVVDNIKQISLRSFNGEELKEYVEHCIKLNTLNIASVDSRRELLPDFLYESEGIIRTGEYADSDVTKQWNKYLEKIRQ